MILLLWVYECFRKVELMNWIELPSKEKFNNFFTGQKVDDKEYETVLMVFEYISNENDKRLSILVLKMRCFFINCCLWNIL